MSSNYFQSSSAAIVCFSYDNRESFGFISQHILDTAMYSTSVKIFVCGNKTDLKEDTPQARCVTDDDVDEFLNSCGSTVCGFFKLSCKTGAGVAEMFHYVASELFSSNFHRFEQPSSIKVKEQKSLTPSRSSCC